MTNKLTMYDIKYYSSVKKKYPNHNEIPPTDNAKDAATAFHVGLQQFRAASWAKLPVSLSIPNSHIFVNNSVLMFPATLGCR